MKLIKKFMFLFTILFVGLFNCTTYAAPDEITVVNSHQIASNQYFGTYVRDSSYKQTVDGKIVYCSDYDKDPPQLQHNFSYTKEDIADAKIAYILMNGYPSNNMTGDQDKDYYITALSIWYFLKPDADIWASFDLDAGTYNGTYNDVANEIGKLVRGANSYSYSTPSISLTLSDAEDSKVIDSYVSFRGTATMTGITGNYTVSVNDAPTGTYVSNMSGTSQTTFSSGQYFLVNVPIDKIESLYSGLDVSVSAEGTVGKAYIYYATNYPEYQDVVTLYTDNVEVGDTDNYSMEKPKKPSKVKISKRDATTGSELAGAKLILKNEDGTIVDSWTSTNEVHIIEGLEAGKYTLIEEIAPDGYIRTTESVEFEISGDGSLNEVIMLNVPIVVKVSKIDITSSKELAGATLSIKDSTGKEIYTWVSTDKEKVIIGLNPGKYVLSEKIAPEGYELMETEIEFTISDDGKVSIGKKIMENNLIVFENSPIPEQVPTGSIAMYVAITLGTLALGAATFFVMKNNKKFNI